ncbi:helix-turn-helix domain-containing protein [Nonomuraea fastidiosa]|uniref:helix-turn-helix domain-containing protein n=1 Tax=Nonomuraea TaxID=83681 RepID=UPI0034156D3C
MPAADMSDLSDVTDGTGLWSAPTTLRALVGAQLRRLREARGVSREEAAFLLRGSTSKISRMEAGRTSFKVRDVADLLTLYGVTDEGARASLLALVEQANAPSWWQEYREAIPDWFEPYLGLEQDAYLIRAFEVQLVPGLLQTEAYARAVIAQGATGSVLEQRVAVRMRRQSVLTGDDPAKLWVVLDEAALHRRVADEATMRAQWEHLARMSELPHVTIQVLPFTSSEIAGGIGPVTILRFPQQQLPDVVYIEQLTTAQYVTKSADVLPHHALMDELGLAALPPDETAGLLRDLAATPSS